MRGAVRLVRVLVSVLLVAVLVEQSFLAPASPTVAQQDAGDAEADVGRPEALGWPGNLGQVGITATLRPGAVDFPPSVDAPSDPALATPTRTAFGPGPSPDPLAVCDDPEQVLAPVTAAGGPTPIPLHQPLPFSTGELVVVSNTNGHGANFRVAPRALARIWRVVPEGEVLEIVGADERVDRVTWAYVRDGAGTVGWIVSHQLTTVGLGPGNPPLPPRTRGVVPCPTAVPTMTPGVIPIPGGITIQINVPPTPAPGGR